jgi:two-component sensor histidine kinase/PAS domain-containing protein
MTTINGPDPPVSAMNSETSNLVRAHDWASTPLGPAESWPASLNALTDMVLACQLPMVLLWGAQLVQIYNDGFRTLMGEKHPAGLGQPTRDCWPEVWHINEPIYARVWRGESVTLTDQLFPITRNGFLEEAYFTLCYSPVRNEAHSVAGVLVTVFETTERIAAGPARRETADALKNTEGLQARETALQESEQRFRALVTASSDALYSMSPTWTEMRQLGGGAFLSETERPSTSWVEQYIPTDDQPEVLKAIRQAVQTKSVFELEHRVRRADGSIGWTLSRAVPLLNEAGEITEWFGAATDVTARRQAEKALREMLAEREALLKEVHHRVKNNLQVIMTMLQMQARQVHERQAFALFEQAWNRVASISSIHELLYRSGSFANVELAIYARELIPRLVNFFDAEQRIGHAVIGENVTLELDRAVPFGLLLNELISNTCKHAFPSGKTGMLTVHLSYRGEDLRLVMSDTGVGLPTDINYEHSSSLGLRLVRALAEQLRGTVTFRSGPGTTIELIMPR